MCQSMRKGWVSGIPRAWGIAFDGRRYFYMVQVPCRQQARRMRKQIRRM